MLLVIIIYYHLQMIFIFFGVARIMILLFHEEEEQSKINGNGKYSRHCAYPVHRTGAIQWKYIVLNRNDNFYNKLIIEHCYRKISKSVRIKRRFCTVFYFFFLLTTAFRYRLCLVDLRYISARPIGTRQRPLHYVKYDWISFFITRRRTYII